MTDYPFISFSVYAALVALSVFGAANLIARAVEWLSAPKKPLLKVVPPEPDFHATLALLRSQAGVNIEALLREPVDMTPTEADRQVYAQFQRREARLKARRLRREAARRILRTILRTFTRKSA